MFILHARKVMLKILQARLQQYVNQEIANAQGGFRKCREIRNQIANICWIIEELRDSRKKSASLTMLKLLTVVDHNKLWKILKEVGLADHLTYLLRNLCGSRRNN